MGMCVLLFPNFGFEWEWVSSGLPPTLHKQEEFGQHLQLIWFTLPLSSPHFSFYKREGPLGVPRPGSRDPGPGEGPRKVGGTIIVIRFRSRSGKNPTVVSMRPGRKRAQTWEEADHSNTG